MIQPKGWVLRSHVSGRERGKGNRQSFDLQWRLIPFFRGQKRIRLENLTFGVMQRSAQDDDAIKSGARS